MVHTPKGVFASFLVLIAVMTLSSISCKLVDQVMPRKPTQAPQIEPLPDAATLPKAVYLGQDGGDYAGEKCSPGNAKDNIHIRLSRLRKNELPTRYRIEDGKGGAWTDPCDPTGTAWMVYTRSSTPGEVDLYFKPNGPAPKATRYLILIQYKDEVILPVVVESTESVP